MFQKLNDVANQNTKNKIKEKKKILIYLVLTDTISRVTYLFQNQLISKENKVDFLLNLSFQFEMFLLKNFKTFFVTRYDPFPKQ